MVKALSEDFVKILISSLIGVVISAGGYWFIQGRYLVTREEVSAMIRTEAPFNSAKDLIDSSIQDRKERERELTKVIEKNSETILMLQIQVAVLSDRLKQYKNEQ